MDKDLVPAPVRDLWSSFLKVLAVPLRALTVPEVTADEPPTGVLLLQLSSGEVRIPLGSPEQIGTPSYWFDQAGSITLDQSNLCMGSTLGEELAACLLGGFGMPSEVAEAAFEAVRDEGLLRGPAAEASAFEEVLCRPLVVAGRSSSVRYRFPAQRASRLAAALRFLEVTELPGDPIKFRDALIECPGVGPKTASWIARNRLRAEVAVVDVHIRRIGVGLCLFDESWKLPRDYGLFEEAFVAFAHAGGVAPAALDACMWWQMHAAGRAATVLLLNQSSRRGRPTASAPTSTRPSSRSKAIVPHVPVMQEARPSSVA